MQDCIAGQKWKCINEDGRWRKHKCKFHREVQNHLAEINKYLTAQQSRRNCACFTPNGLVYTKIKSERDLFQQKTKRFDAKHKLHNKRHKRDVDEIYNDKLPPDLLDLLRIDDVVENIGDVLIDHSSNEHTRKKRETDYITQTIDELHSMLITLEKKYNSTTKNPVQCFVESSGKVNCSTVVYENEQAWKESRAQIDMLLKVLKNKINNLKDIKKHLREHKPNNVTDDDYIENSSTSIEEKSEEFDDTTKMPRKNITKHTTHSQQLGTERRKRIKVSSSTTEASPATDSSTEPSDNYLLSSSTTDANIEESSTTLSSPSTTKNSSHKPRYRTKIPKTSTTTSTTTDTSTVSETSENILFSTSEPETTESDVTNMTTSIEYSTAVLESSTLKQDTFDSNSVTIDATIIEPKPRHQKHRHHQLTDTVPKNNFTNEFSQFHRSVSKTTLPADCYCEPEFESPPSLEREIARDARKKLKEERQRKKERKRHKKAKMEKECLTEKMNCFSHDCNHWRTAPLWEDDPFCFCMNANNNTYSCLRTINQTHNYLYCEFTTGLITFYNLKKGELTH